MRTPQKEIDELLRRPNEGLNVEVKSWLNLDDPNDVAKVVKGTFALRNRNGGFFIIGLDNNTLQPATANQPSDIHTAYHVDKIQGIISKYASLPFEIEVAFGQVGGVEVAVIGVPNGVPYPVATKAHLEDENGKHVVGFAQVYFRTLNANGTPSTAVAQPQDWREIFEICFENRDADFERHIRRLARNSGLGNDAVTALLAVIAATKRKSDDDDGQGGGGDSGPPGPPSNISGGALLRPTLRHETLSFLEEGMQRFSQTVLEKKLDPDTSKIATGGSWEVSLVISPQKEKQLPTNDFRNILASSNPRFTGWPVWLDSSSFSERAHRPIVKDNGWETFIVSLDSWSKHLDYYRFDPHGKFYLHRNLQDDTSDKVKSGKALDPILVIIRIAEAVAVGLSFAKALDWVPDETTLGIAARWSKLKGRTLESWANPLAYVSPHGEASDDVATSFIQLPLDTPVSAIAPAVEQLVRPLFVLFDGFEMPKPSIEQWVQRLVERRLNS